MSYTEAHIIVLLKERDKSVLQMIYDKWGDALYGIICNITKDEYIAQDVLQETLLKIWQKSDSFDPTKAKLFTWMYQIARNKAIDAYRKKGKTHTDEIQFAETIVSHMTSDTPLYYSELDKNIERLDPKYQEVLKTLFYQGMTQQEMSDESGIPIGTIKSRLRIALRELRNIYVEKMTLLSLLISWIYGG